MPPSFSLPRAPGQKRNYQRMRNARRAYRRSALDLHSNLRAWIRATGFGVGAPGKLGRIAAGK